MKLGKSLILEYWRKLCISKLILMGLILPLSTFHTKFVYSFLPPSFPPSSLKEMAWKEEDSQILCSIFFFKKTCSLRVLVYMSTQWFCGRHLSCDVPSEWIYFSPQIPQRLGVWSSNRILRFWPLHAFRIQYQLPSQLKHGRGRRAVVLLDMMNGSFKKWN